MHASHGIILHIRDTLRITPMCLFLPPWPLSLWILAQGSHWIIPYNTRQLQGEEHKGVGETKAKRTYPALYDSTIFKCRELRDLSVASFEPGLEHGLSESGVPVLNHSALPAFREGGRTRPCHPGDIFEI